MKEQPTGHQGRDAEPASLVGLDPTARSGPTTASPPESRAFEIAYEGTPTWDIGRPQGAVIRLEEAGVITGSVLDVGCGTGENALYLAGRGHPVLGIDFARRAIARARGKARRARSGQGEAASVGSTEPAVGDRRSPVVVEFIVWDALRVAELGRSFDTILDVGLFHTLQPHRREPYATSLRSAIPSGGRALVLCWSDRNPFGYGPERIRRTDIRAAFRRGWKVESIREERLESRLPSGSVHAWLAILRAA